MNSITDNNAFSPADILLPKDADMAKWAVVACDQFTSEPEYWEETESIVGDEKSALNLILPEVYLGHGDEEKRIRKINENMKAYLDGGVFKTLPDSLIYVERTQSDGSVRCGIVGKADLENYEFRPGNKALIRATEGTVLSRIPPRVKVRENAPVELPHVMLLIDDPLKTVIEPLSGRTGEMEKVYDFDLMKEGGHIRGYRLTEEDNKAVCKALGGLRSQEIIDEKYGIKGAAPLLFAVGDGNHSLATAKQCYENEKKNTPEDKWDTLLSRYALVEVVNLHEDALKFEPIHRTLFETDPEDIIKCFLEYHKGSFNVLCDSLSGGYEKNLSPEQKDLTGRDTQYIGYCYGNVTGMLVVPKPEKQLAVGTLQEFLDKYIEEHGTEIDYIHGDETCEALGRKPGNISFLLPAMGKEQLFKTVMADGVLPRKTFSMGHAADKRYYIEARRIK